MSIHPDATLKAKLIFSKPLRTIGGLKARYIATANVKTFPHILLVTKDDGEEAINRCDDYGEVPVYINPKWRMEQAPQTMELFISLLKQSGGQVDWIATSQRPTQDTLACKKITISEGEYHV